LSGIRGNDVRHPITATFQDNRLGVMRQPIGDGRGRLPPFLAINDLRGGLGRDSSA